MYDLTMLSPERAPESLVPRPISALEPTHPDLQARELVALKVLELAGINLAPTLVVPAAVEERFYRLNNLPEKLNGIMQDVDPDDPDEDDVEDAAPAAVRLFKTHFLLDEFIDIFYAALSPLPSKVHVRRSGAEGRVGVRGRPTLIALKETWADAWRYDALLARLLLEHTVALEARPVILGAEDKPASAEVLEQVTEVLARANLKKPTKVWTDEASNVARLSFPESTND